MPFTPFHFGPALAAREIIGHKRFGIWSFAATQVALDLDPAIHMLFNLAGELHEYTHTYSGGGIICLLAIAALWRRERWGAVVGSEFGVLSHLWLDAIYHVDVAANLAKWRNPASAREAGTDAELICVAGFVVWILLAGVRKVIQQRRQRAVS